MSGDRKIGNNKEFCKMYKSSGRLEKNKARRKATSERRKANTASRIAKRIKQGKTVHSRHKPKVTAVQNPSRGAPARDAARKLAPGISG